jgi:hypothetical protein
MQKPVQQLLFWSPRILCILFAGFISMFALDVFDEYHGFLEIAKAMLIHLIPTYIILLALALEH